MVALAAALLVASALLLWASMSCCRIQSAFALVTMRLDVTFAESPFWTGACRRGRQLAMT